MKKIYLLLMFIGIAGLGFGQTIASYDFSDVGAVTGFDEASPGIALDANIGFGSFKNSASTNPGLYSGQLRLYQNATKGGSIKIYPSNGVTITQVIVHASGTTGPAAYTVDGGSSTDLSNGTTYTMSSLSATSVVEFYQKDGSSGNRIYVDDFEVTYTSGGSGPANPTSFSIDYVADTKMELSWTNAANSDGVIIVAKQGSATGVTQAELNTAEVNYGDFTNSGNFTAANQDMKDDYGVTVATGNILVYSGTGTSVTITNLTNQQDYYYVIFNEYGTAVSSNWSSGTSDINDVAEVQGTSSFAASRGDTEVDLSWTNYIGTVTTWWDEVLVLAKAGSAVSGTPTGDGSLYTANAAFGSGTEVGTDNYVVYKGTGTSQTVTSLTNGTAYHFRTFVRYGSVWTDVDEWESADATPAEIPKLIISEVADPGDVYQARFIEFYNLGSSVIDFDSEVWYLSRQTNGGSTWEDKQLTGSIAPDATYISANYNENTSDYFYVNFGFMADFDYGGSGGNGDDGYFLYKGGNHSSGTLIDAYGVIDETGSGTWGYENKKAIRKTTVTTPNTTWTASEWTITAADVADCDPGEYNSNVSWKGGSGNWSTASNWSNGNKPGSSTNVYVPSGATLSVDEAASVQNMNVQDGGKLNVDVTYTLSVGTTITIENGGSFINNGTLNNGAKAEASGIMQRTIDAYSSNENGWHLLSSPVGTFDINGSDFDPGSNDDLYGWSESTWYWMNHKVGNPSQMVLGTGYLVSYETTATKDFTGTFNNADVTFTNLSLTDLVKKGWHLVGNPFQSALQWTSTDWVRASIGAAAKIMNSGGSYTDITVGGTDIIPANQGFFIEATVNNSNTFTIPKSQRVHSSTAFYKNSIPNILTLKAIVGNYYQESTIQFMDGSTDAYDEEYDVDFLAGISEEAPQFYSIIEENELSTNRIPTPENEKSVLMGFSTLNETVITIEANGVDSFTETIEILLEDLQEDIIVNLRENPSYTFISNPDNSIERFKVYFKSTLGIDNPNQSPNQIQIWSSNNTIQVINNQNLVGDISIVNLFGQVIANYELTGDTRQQVDFTATSGLYIVNVKADNGVVSTKKIYIK